MIINAPAGSSAGPEVHEFERQLGGSCLLENVTTAVFVSVQKARRIGPDALYALITVDVARECANPLGVAKVCREILRLSYAIEWANFSGIEILVRRMGVSRAERLLRVSAFANWELQECGAGLSEHDLAEAEPFTGCQVHVYSPELRRSFELLKSSRRLE